MNPWALPALLAAFGSAALCVLAYLKDPRAALNRVFVCFAAATALNAFTSYGHLQAETVASATYWLRVASMWPFSLALQLHVVLVLRAAQRKPSAWLLLALYASAAATALVMLVGWDVAVEAHHEHARWAASYAFRAPRSKAFELLPMAYAAAINALSIALCVRCVRGTVEPRRRTQAMHVLSGVALPGILGFVSEGLLPHAGVHLTAALPFGIVLGAALVARGVIRYGLFSLDARVASDEIIDTMEEGLLIVDREQKITAANRAAQVMLCGTSESLGGRHIQSVLPAAPSLHGPSARLSNDRISLHEAEFELRAANHNRLTASVSARSVIVDGENLGAVVVVRDITESKDARARLAHAATHDALTGLPNRSLLCDRLELAIARAKRNRTSVGLIFLDLDSFKEINDVLGHEAGDQLLKETGMVLQRTLRGCDTVARLGGDEFVVMLDELTDKAGAEIVARRLGSRLREEVVVAGRHQRVAASLGISVFPADADDVQTLLRTADIAMYVQKARGGDGFAFFADDMRSTLEQRTKIKTELQHALDRDQLALHYQPLFDARTGAMRGMEALLRWHHPELGMVSPATFIPVAEETGAILPIGEWVVRTACRQAWELEQQGLGRLPIAVNLSARQLRAPNLAATILRTLRAYDLGPERLVLEVTESALMENEEQAATVLSELHGHGLQISLDDFGTGYSSLGRLRALPISTLKIDRCFVQHVAEVAADLAIVRAIVAMARSLGMRVIAEGVETREQLEALRNLGSPTQGELSVDEVQGYLFSRPVDADALATLLRQQQPNSAVDAMHARVDTLN